MKFFTLVLVAAITVSFEATAARALKVEQINQSKRFVAISGASGSLIGQELVINLSDGTQCTVQVSKVEKGMALAQYEVCPQAGKIRKGDRVDQALFSTETSASSTSAPVQAVSVQVTNLNSHLQESWYTYWGAGFPAHGFSDPQTSRMSGIVTEEKRNPMVDILGFYWPSAGVPGWIRGLVLNNDHFYSNRFESTGAAVIANLSVSQTLLGFSNYYFIRKVVGSGFFVRGDIGLLDRKVEIFETNKGQIDHQESVVGALLGLGGSLPVAEGTRVLFQLTHKQSAYGKFNVPVTSVSAGLLF